MQTRRDLAGDSKEKTCELFYTSIRNLTPEKALATCATNTINSELKQLKAPAPAPPGFQLNTLTVRRPDAGGTAAAVARNH